MEVEEEQAPPLLRISPSSFYGYLKPSTCGLRLWLREQGVEEEPPSEFREALMGRGLEHEARHLLRFPGHIDIGKLPRDEQFEATIEEVRACDRVIYQGRLQAETTLAGRQVEIIGLPDFMLPARNAYAIRDSKLNRSLNQTTEHVRLQLETYGWLYEQTFGEPPVALQVHLGSDEIETIDYEGGGDALATFEEMLEFRLAEEEPAEYVGVSKCGSCAYYSHCWPKAVERLDVGILPRVDSGLVAALHEQGAGTIPELLEKFDVESLTALERPWRDGTPKPYGDGAERTLISARALNEDRPILIHPPAIPAHDTYVMFDLEGVQASNEDPERIYIWGIQPFGKGAGEFRAGVAGFGGTGDVEGWEDFLRKADAIFTKHGDIPFVHWANYEKTKVNLYLERYGDRDGVAERVLSNLLDLLPITRASVAVPLSGYGLKEIETLTGYERQLEEYGGDWSMAKYMQAAETSDEAERALIMDEILAYNREDLEATWAVMEWLRGLGIEGELDEAGIDKAI